MDEGGWTPIFGAIVSRNEAAVELLLTHGSRLDIRGSKKDIKKGQVCSPPELANKLGFSKFHQIQRAVQLNKEEADRDEAARKEAEKKEVEKEEEEKKKAESNEAENKEAKTQQGQKMEAEKTGEAQSKVTNPKDWVRKYKEGKKNKKEEPHIDGFEKVSGSVTNKKSDHSAVGKEERIKELGSNPLKEEQKVRFPEV